KGAAAKLSNTELKPGGKLATFVGGFGAKGLAFTKVEADKFVGGIDKFLPAAVQSALRERFGAGPGDVLLFVADTEDVAAQALGNLRTHLANVLKLYDPNAKEFKVAWVVDFPSFLFDAEEERWAANHHPFTSPRDEDLQYLESDPGRV